MVWASKKSPKNSVLDDMQLQKGHADVHLCELLLMTSVGEAGAYRNQGKLI